MIFTHGSDGCFQDPGSDLGFEVVNVSGGDVEYQGEASRLGSAAESMSPVERVANQLATNSSGCASPRQDLSNLWWPSHAPTLNLPAARVGRAMSLL